MSGTREHWEEEFDLAASHAEDHDRVLMNKPMGPVASYRVAADYVQGQRILDVGCGSGGFAKHYIEYRIIGCDFSAKQLLNAKEHCPVVRCDAGRLPFRDHSFDTVTCIGVIQNCGWDPEVLVSELCRVSRGRVFMTGLSKYKRNQNDEQFYADPVEVASLFMKKFGVGTIKYGAIKYNEEGRVWDEPWDLWDNGTFYIWAVDRW